MGRAVHPRVAITPGDPAGIGPSVLLRAWANCRYDPRVCFCGEPQIWLNAAKAAGIDQDQLRPLLAESTPVAAAFLDVRLGVGNAASAKLAWHALDEAIAGACRGEFAALVTGPIAKATMLAAGFAYAGHTEYLQARFAAPAVLMVMYAPGFIVGLNSLHIPLAQVAERTTADSVAMHLRLLNDFLLAQKTTQSPRIAVAGLNPHAGEQGHLGNEEERIRQGMAMAARMGLKLSGPLPGDTVFYAMAQGDYDAVLAMYHDQGLAPFKLKHFNDGVNVTVGLPVLRTSPDHGTAYALAASGGKVDAGSATAALQLALTRVAQL